MREFIKAICVKHLWVFLTFVTVGSYAAESNIQLVEISPDDQALLQGYVADFISSCTLETIKIEILDALYAWRRWDYYCLKSCSLVSSLLYACHERLHKTAYYRGLRALDIASLNKNEALGYYRRAITRIRKETAFEQNATHWLKFLHAQYEIVLRHDSLDDDEISTQRISDVEAEVQRELALLQRHLHLLQQFTSKLLLKFPDLEDDQRCCSCL